MAQARIVMWGFVVAGVLFFVAALLPLLGGGRMNAVFFPVGLVFLILAAAKAKEKRAPDDSVTTPDGR